MIAVVVGLTLPSFAQAGGRDCVDINTRPLEDLLSAQGSASSFFPPVPDYLGWAGADFVTFGLVDYAGLAAEYLAGEGVDLGTNVRGLVTECELADGSVRIAVALVTENAIGFAQDIADLAANDFDFAATDTSFGNKAVDVADGADAAVGPAEFFVSFHIDAPGDPLPDLLDVLNATERSGKLVYEPVALTFASLTDDGEGKCLTVYQEAVSGSNGKALVFVAEEVFVADCEEAE